MRKVVKKELIQIIEQLNKANELIQKQIGVIDAQELVSLLAECQESAVVVGGRIDQEAGEGTQAVHLLEEYCEGLYQLSIVLDNKQKAQEQIQRINNCLSNVIDSISNNLPDTREVVFLPYKASMWDSLESIWMAAKADENCNAYVIPIPYYDKNPDGSFKEEHYEADQYPEYVPVTHYNEYNFATHRPDVIFIHNPYDDYNHVTSVHPFFYSKNLRQFTKQLVYVPYYVTGGFLNEMQRLLPSYINVDHVIVQNDEQKKLFIPEIGQKVSAFGSPKFDKVINLQIMEDMIPDDWKTKLQNPILFLNTGIDGILKNDQNSLLKIQYVIDVAKTEKVTLLWRPHPLLESTIQSMRPELWELYLETVKRFKQLPNGILDRTGNAELAIKISDAYLGEPTSSISHMFGVLGKPLFFIKQNILEEEECLHDVKICSCVGEEDENVLWALVTSRNGLLKLNNQGEIEKYYVIPGEADKSNLYSDILIAEGKLYLVPRNAKEIAVFDISSALFTKIPLKNQGQKEKFNKGYYYKGKVYFIPRLYSEMVTLDCADNRLDYDKTVVDALREITKIPDILVSANATCLSGESIYLAAPNKPYLLKWNLLFQTVQIYEIQGTTSGFCCIEMVDNKMIMGSMEGCELIVWDSIKNTSEVIRDFPKEWNTQEDICFWDIVELHGQVYVFPRKNTMVLRLSLSDLSIMPVEKDFPFSIENRQDIFHNHPNHFLMVKKLYNGKVIVQDANRHGVSQFFEDGTFLWKNVTLTEKEETSAFEQYFARQGKNLPWGIYETKNCSVRRLISYIRLGMHNEEKQKAEFLNAAKNLDGSAGQKIYEFIKASL